MGAKTTPSQAARRVVPQPKSPRQIRAGEGRLAKLPRQDRAENAQSKEPSGHCWALLGEFPPSMEGLQPAKEALSSKKTQSAEPAAGQDCDPAPGESDAEEQARQRR